MPLESATFISDLVATNPAPGDPKSQGDDHLRLLKSTSKNTWQNIAGAVTATHLELNALVGAISTGTTSLRVETKATTDNSTFAASTAFVQGRFAAVLPNVTTTTVSTAKLNALELLTTGEIGALAGAATTGATVRLVTQPATDSSTLGANTAYVQAVLSTVVGSAPTPVWVSGASYTAGQLVYSPVNFQTYRRRTSGGGTTDPSLSADWERISSGPFLPFETRTSNTALTDVDSQKFLALTGTFTQTFSAVAGLRSGWWVILRNAGAGDITLDPNGSELIDGLTSYVMYPGEARLIQCDGTTLRSVVLNPFFRVFTTSGSFVRPPGYSLFSGLAWGGGGSGNSVPGSSGSRGGGGGECLPFTVPSSVLSATTTVTVAAAAPGTPGGVNNGNATLFGTLFTASGGTFSSNGVGANNVGTALYKGGDGNTGTTAHNAIFGGGGGGGDSNTAGGTSVFGGAGGEGGATGVAGTAPGGGGGGSVLNAPGGTGARGELRIWGVC